MDARRCLALACLAAFGALFLQGCGGGSDSTTSTTSGIPTPAPTTITTTSTSATTTTTATTRTGYGGCLGKDIDTFNPAPDGKPFNWGSACFCFYTGNCLEFFLPKCWNVSIDIKWCQQRWCGQAPFYTGPQFVSFFNHNQMYPKAPNPDLLTIPQIWFLNINHLKDQCDDKGALELQNLLTRGRKDFAGSDGANPHTSGVPQWQCLHVQRWVGVEWLHLHTFNGVVHGEELPDVAFPYTPRHALCGSGSQDVDTMAKWMLANIPKTFGAHEQQFGSEAARLAWAPDGLKETLEQVV